MLSNLFAVESLVATVVKDDINVRCYKPTLLGRLKGVKPRKTVKLVPTGYGPWYVSGRDMSTETEYPLIVGLELDCPGNCRMTFGKSWRPEEHTVKVEPYGFGTVKSTTYRITANGVMELVSEDYGDITIVA
jgi:hypothetical protein